MPRGTLYIVATPLGNLGDLTARAAELLRVVPMVAAEDSRRSRTLLSHLGATPRVVSYHAHSGAGASGVILRALAEGSDVALVTDAGTPGVSDPGAALVALVREQGYTVVPLPGPSAVGTALSAGGLPADRYLFLGFPPRKGPERARLVARVAVEEWTSVLFEAPGRIGALLKDLAETAGGDRRAVLARELTKVHEEFVTGTLSELAVRFADPESARGECTLLVAGTIVQEEPDQDAARHVAERLLSEGLTRKAVAGILTDLFGVSRNQAYEMTVRRETSEVRRETSDVRGER